jgi:hypothetical protein
VGLTTLPCKKIVEKPPRNSAGFCGGGQGLSWAVEPGKEGKKIDILLRLTLKTREQLQFNALQVNVDHCSSFIRFNQNARIFLKRIY